MLGPTWHENFGPAASASVALCELLHELGGRGRGLVLVVDLRLNTGDRDCNDLMILLKR
jgi:hypothetical protein